MIKLSKLPVFDFFSLLKPAPPPRRELKARRVVQAPPRAKGYMEIGQVISYPSLHQ